MYVRTADDEAGRACEPGVLAADGGSMRVTADTPVAAHPNGPFRPLAVAILADATLRASFARAIRVPSSAMWARMRFVALALAAYPLLMLLELDRELVSKGMLGAGRLVIDGLALAYVAFELLQKTPRLPWIASVALAAASLRWFLVAARLCAKNVHSAVWVGAALAGLGAAVIAVRAPTRARLSLELLDKLGISRHDANVARRPPGTSNAAFGAAIAFSGALPLLAWQLRMHRVGLETQAIVLLAFALVAPFVMKRVSADAMRDPRRDLFTTLAVIAAGLTLIASLLYGSHQFVDIGEELMRCTNRLDNAARKLMMLEQNEISRRIAQLRASTALVVLTVGVVPLVEEQIYRGVLMNVLSKRFSFGYALFVSSIVFGFTHYGVYEIAVYQTVLLGFGFGLAYAEGGLLAAYVVHAAWNLLNVA